VARAWRDDLVESVMPPASRFTRILPGTGIERDMRLSDLEGLSRAQAIRLGRERGAQRVVRGSIGAVRSSTKLQLFTDTIARRVMEKAADGTESVHWLDVPIEVVSASATSAWASTDEIIETATGSSVSHRHFERPRRRGSCGPPSSRRGSRVVLPRLGNGSATGPEPRG
jgi:hypothetical protein